MVKQVEYEQPTSKEVPKIAAVRNAGVAITAIVTLLALTGIVVPDNISEAAQDGVAAFMVIIAAGQAILTWAAGYWKKDVKPAGAVNIIKSQSPEDLRG